MDDRPSCQRCNTRDTRFYRHVFEGGYHIGLYCLTCRTHAQTARTWYSRNAFSEAELKALPTLEKLKQDPRQGNLF
jgi:hypothetical protein